MFRQPVFSTEKMLLDESILTDNIDGSMRCALCYLKNKSPDILFILYRRILIVRVIGFIFPHIIMLSCRILPLLRLWHVAPDRLFAVFRKGGCIMLLWGFVPCLSHNLKLTELDGAQLHIAAKLAHVAVGYLHPVA